METGWAWAPDSRPDSLPWQAAQLLSDLGSENAKKWLSDAQSGLTRLAEERQREIARKAEIERRHRSDAKQKIEKCLHDWRSVSDGFDGENSFLVCRRCCIQVTDQGYSNGQLERGIPRDPRVKWFSPDGAHLQLIEIEKELLRAVLRGMSVAEFREASHIAIASAINAFSTSQPDRAVEEAVSTASGSVFKKLGFAKPSEPSVEDLRRVAQYAAEQGRL